MRLFCGRHEFIVKRQQHILERKGRKRSDCRNSARTLWHAQYSSFIYLPLFNMSHARPEEGEPSVGVAFGRQCRAASVLHRHEFIQRRTNISPQEIHEMLPHPLTYLFPRSQARPVMTQILPLPGIFSHEPLTSCVL